MVVKLLYRGTGTVFDRVFFIPSKKKKKKDLHKKGRGRGGGLIRQATSPTVN
jgi:hypothetical protein